MKAKKTTVILYLGFNGFIEHKRGVENVIAFQAKACPELVKMYVYFGEKNEVYRWNNIICISIKKTLIRFLELNFLIFNLYNKYDRILIHSHNYLMSFFILKRINLMTVHDALYYQVKCLNRNFKFIFKLIELAVYRKTSLIHFISSFAKSQSLLKSGSTFVVIPNTSHLEQMIQLNSETPSSPILDNESYVFSVRSIEERAGIDLLIDVAEHYQMKGERLNFLVAGKGPMLEHYKQIIMDRGIKNIYMLGYVSDNELVSYYRKCSIVLITAKYAEGFGLPIIEGYLFNRPVIASNVCAIPEVIFDTSFLFENKIQSIIDKIDSVLKLQDKSYRKFYLENFGNHIIISRFDNLYKSFLNK